MHARFGARVVRGGGAPLGTFFRSHTHFSLPDLKMQRAHHHLGRFIHECCVASSRDRARALTTMIFGYLVGRLQNGVSVDRDEGQTLLGY